MVISKCISWEQRQVLICIGDISSFYPKIYSGNSICVTIDMLSIEIAIGWIPRDWW